MTLVETVTVLFIVGILVAFVTGLARHAARRAETARTGADLQLLADALERYYLRFGEYPLDFNDWHTVSNLLEHSRPLDFAADPNDRYAFSNSLPHGFSGLDPWQRHYLYGRFVSDDMQDETFDLISAGPDVDSPHDDITL